MDYCTGQAPVAATLGILAVQVRNLQVDRPAGESSGQAAGMLDRRSSARSSRYQVPSVALSNDWRQRTAKLGVWLVRRAGPEDLKDMPRNMAPRAHCPHVIQISLRELLLLVAFFAIGCAALKTAGNVWWTVLSAFTLLVFMGFATVAAVDRGPRQSFALGFVICTAIYGVLLGSQPAVGAVAPSNRELDPYTGKMPTTKLLLPVFQAMMSVKWVDSKTGEEIPNYDPSQASVVSSGSFVSYSEAPHRQDFMAIGHLLWCVLFGYAGGHVARVVYLRRVSRDIRSQAGESNETSSSV